MGRPCLLDAWQLGRQVHPLTRVFIGGCCRCLRRTTGNHAAIAQGAPTWRCASCARWLGLGRGRCRCRCTLLNLTHARESSTKLLLRKFAGTLSASQPIEVCATLLPRIPFALLWGWVTHTQKHTTARGAGKACWLYRGPSGPEGPSFDPAGRARPLARRGQGLAPPYSL
jgi:hypothetical protein